MLMPMLRRGSEINLCFSVSHSMLPAPAQIPLQPAERGRVTRARELTAVAAKVVWDQLERGKDTVLRMRGSSASVCWDGRAAGLQASLFPCGR